MYTGLSAALLRQATYTTTQMGKYFVFLRMHCDIDHDFCGEVPLSWFHWTGTFKSMSDAVSQNGQSLSFYKIVGCGLVRKPRTVS